MSEEEVNSIVEVTGASDEEAKYLLAACGNVEAAVALFFENGGVNITNGPTDLLGDELENTTVVLDDEVRAPIAPKRETLVGPDDDNFRTAAAERMLRVPQRVKICPLRDFAREGALMEERLRAEAASSSTANGHFSLAEHFANSPTPRRRISRGAQMVALAESAAAGNRSSRLGDLFRPPTDIAFSGTFASARAQANDNKQWLLVNVQNDNFDSQLLNRDIWSDKTIRDLLRRMFLLWQVDAETSEGLRFVAFYHCGKLPYLCIVDPRTGEEMWKSTDLTLDKICKDLTKFISEHRDFIGDEAPTTSKRSIECIAIDDDEDYDVVECNPIASTSAQANINNSNKNLAAKKRTKLLELTEEEQIALAIKNSMKENGKNGFRNSHDDSDDDDDDDDDNAHKNEFNINAKHANNKQNLAIEESYETYLGEDKDDLTMLKMRLFNAEGADEMIQLRWPSDTRLQTLRMYIDQNYVHMTKGAGYKIICAFPRKPLESTHDLSTLKELGLHPSANLHVTQEEEN